MHLSMLAPTPLPGEVGQSWGFDLTRIKSPHPPGNVRIQILTGHALRAFRTRTLAIQYPDPWGKPAIPNKENSPPCPRWGLTLIGALYSVVLVTRVIFLQCVPYSPALVHSAILILSVSQEVFYSQYCITVAVLSSCSYNSGYGFLTV